MNVLFLGPSDNALIGYMETKGDRVRSFDKFFRWNDIPPFYDCLVSYGYQYILPKQVLDFFPLAINLHISMLPWNRGADPNLWSWIEDTPKGVTIHHIDEGVDTGDIIAQWAVQFGPDETLATSYQLLKQAIDQLFVDTWPSIRNGTAPRIKQPEGGSFHRKSDRAKVEHLLTKGWDTPVAELQNQLKA